MYKLKFSIFLSVLVLIFTFANDVKANEAEAKKFVDTLSDRVVKVIESSSLSEKEKQTRLEKLFKDSVDTEWMGRFVLGKYFRQATAAQKKRYLKLYSDFLLLSYIPRFKEYTGQKLVINDIVSKSDGQYIIESELVSDSAESPAIKVDYRLLKNGNGKYYVIDIVGEGISLITTQRSDFAGLISKKGIGTFIDKLQARVESLKAKS